MNKNMNKKILAVFLIILAAAIIVLPRARANGNSSAEFNKTEEEDINPMRFPHGAEVRLLQLEKSITRNILVGNQTIAAIKAGNSSANTSGLLEIIDKLIVPRTEVQGIKLNGTPEELAQQFVDIKREAINLSKQFRDAARPLLKETDRKIIREYMKELDRSELKNMNNEINDARHEYNYAFLNATFSHLGLNNSALLEQIRNGDAKFGDIKKYVKDALTNETSKERQQAMLRLREAEAKKNVYVEAVKTRVISNNLERMSERSAHMSEVLKNLSDKQGHMSENMKEISQQLKERRDNRR